MATFTPFANNVVTALSYESGGPGSLSRGGSERKRHSLSYIIEKTPTFVVGPKYQERAWTGRG